MAIRKAQPPAPKHAKAIRRNPLNLAKTQADFEQEAMDLSASLGWEGPGENVLDDIQVADAYHFLRKSLHEKYVHGELPDRCKAPTVDGIAKHLGIDDEERLAILRAKFE